MTGHTDVIFHPKTIKGLLKVPKIEPWYQVPLRKQYALTPWAPCLCCGQQHEAPKAGWSEPASAPSCCLWEPHNNNKKYYHIFQSKQRFCFSGYDERFPILIKCHMQIPVRNFGWQLAFLVRSALLLRIHRPLRMLGRRNSGFLLTYLKLLLLTNTRYLHYI